MMFGIDLSQWQNGINLSKIDGLDFAIVKATEGVSFTDPSFHNHILQLTELGKEIGVYHFARPDNHNTVEAIQKEADFFVKTVRSKNLIGRSILVLDWEVNPIARVDLAEAWLKHVKELTGITPFIYANQSTATKYLAKLIKKYPLWLAYWPDEDTMKFPPTEQWLKNYEPYYVQNVGVPWTIWQCTDVGKVPGWDSHVDISYTPMTEEDWRAFELGYGPSYMEPANKALKEILNSDEKWAMDMGFFHGYADGSFHPEEPLTRGQAASVLRRLWNTMYKDSDSVKEVKE